jgi:hypothetical protein
MHLSIPFLLIPLSLAACANQSNVAQDIPKQVSSAASEKDTSGISVENPYARTYVSRNLSPTSLKSHSEAPHIYLGKSKEDDYQSMLENGFDLLGYSSFEAGDVPVSQLGEQAQKVKAETVLVYTERTAQTPSSIKIQQMKEQQRIATNPELAKMGKPMITEQANYAYFAAYWAKLQTPIIGMHVKGSRPDEASKGLRVQAVINDSPAQLAGLQMNDVVLSIGEIAMVTPEALIKASQRYAGQLVELAYERDGKPVKVSVKLNPRP